MVVVDAVAVTIRDVIISTDELEGRIGGYIIIVAADAGGTGVEALKAPVFTTLELLGADTGTFAAVTAVVV